MVVTNIKHLCYVLNTSINEIDSIINNIDKFYYTKKEVKLDDDGNPKKDKNNEIKYRVINPSRGELKKIQKNIYKKILLHIKLPSNIKGSVKGESNISNAKFHQGNKYKFVTDLKDFFPRISNSQIMKTLLSYGFSKKVSSYLTKLTTYQGHLPQGTSTSAALANIVFLPTDLILIDYCNLKKIKYTRFVDDLTFSSKKDFKNYSMEILEIIKKSKSKISYKKTFYTPGIAEITGIPTKNNSIVAPDRVRKKLNLKELTEKQKQGIQNYISNIHDTNKKTKRRG